MAMSYPNDEGSDASRVVPLNPASRPRVAFVNVPDEMVDQLEPLCGTARRFDHLGLWERNWTPSETDIIVTCSTVLNVDSGIHLMLRGDAGSDVFQVGRQYLLRIQSHHQAALELSTPPSLPDFFADAVDQLVSSLTGSETPATGLVSQTEGLLTPLVLSTDRPIAAYYPRVEFDTGLGGGGWGLAIPEPADPNLWFRAFLNLIHQEDSEAVPNLPSRFTRSEIWYTPHELQLSGLINDLRDKAMDIATEIGQLEEELRTAEAGADTKERAVLYTDGEELEDAVADFLRELGFRVDLVDRQIPEGQARVEDYHITTSDSDDWMAVGETKGYSKGARSNDLGDINKHVKAFIRRERREPDRVWWFINDYRTRDPGTRDATLKGQEKQPANFDVVAIPTRGLYQLWRSVELGEIDRMKAREILIDTDPGIFSYPFEGAE